MKYHVTISAAYWPANVEGWEELTAKERSQAMRDHMERISFFLNDNPQHGETRLLVTDGNVTIDPLHGDIGIRAMDVMERNTHLHDEPSDHHHF